MVHRDHFPSTIMPASAYSPGQGEGGLRPLENRINLWQELRSLLPAIGSWHLIRHYVDTQKCSCRRERTNDDANPSCPLCFGRGFPYTETAALMATSNQVAAGASPEMVGSVFTISEESVLFFASPDTQVTTSDMIFQVALTADQRIEYPVRILGRYDVGRVLAQRADRTGAIDLLMILANESEGTKQ